MLKKARRDILRLWNGKRKNCKKAPVVGRSSIIRWICQAEISVFFIKTNEEVKKANAALQNSIEDETDNERK